MNPLWQFAAMGALERLDDMADAHGLKRDYFKPVYYTGCSYDGHLYALPYDFGTDLLFYNKTMFKQAGATPPNTYAEMLTAMAKLQKAGHTPFGARERTPPSRAWLCGFTEPMGR